MILSIVKRDGRTVLYEQQKIATAILKALVEAGEASIAEADLLAERVCLTIEQELNGHTPTVEQIQDVVERILMATGHDEAAKKYILYRADRTRIREAHTSLMKSIDQIVNADARDCDSKRDNANVDGNTSMGSMLQMGTSAAKAYNAAWLLSPEQAKAYTEGDIHIHDFEFYALTETCCQIDLLKLFHGGFAAGHGFVREPQSIRSYASLAVMAIQANQNDQHGGQGIPNFDYAMAEGVAKSYVSIYRRELAEALEDALESEDEAARAAETLTAVESVGKPRLQAGAEAFDAAVAAHLMQTTALPLQEAEKLVRRVRRRTDKQVTHETRQAMEGVIHTLNVTQSRAGAQTPFSSINYGTDVSPEGQLVIRSTLEALDAGLGNGETAIFPIHIFKVKEGVNYNPGDPGYELFRYSCRVSAKRLFPNYVFLDAPFNLQYYRPGRPETEVATMGCRTRVMGNVYDPDREIAFGRGNLSFTTINLPRIALEACRQADGTLAVGHGDEAKFYARLDELLALCAKQLMDRYHLQAAKHVYNYPVLMGQGIWLDRDKLGPNDPVGEVLKHGSLSIGFIGLAEALTALYGHHHGEGKEYWDKGYAIIEHMRRFADAEAQRTRMNYSILGTPAEGLSGRFTKLDRKRYGEIANVTDREYYTNSFHIPVWYQVRAFEKINLEAPFHGLCNAGHITYVELDGNTAQNVEAFESVVRCMHDAGVGYGSVNHPVDRDPVCGYVGVIGDVCPRCGRRNGEAIAPERLAELQKKYPQITRFRGHN